MWSETTLIKGENAGPVKDFERRSRRARQGVRPFYCPNRLNSATTVQGFPFTSLVAWKRT